MVAVPHKNLWFFYLISALCYIFEGSTVEVVTTIPPKVKSLLDRANVTSVKDLLKNSRRILNGRPSNGDKPYMVYLKLPSNSAQYQDYKRWLCGGVIVHEEYILTSAACIQDVKHFYIVSGLNTFSPEDDMHTNPCIKNGARKAIWKCIPRNYIFEGHENDNIRWMNNDIAVVKVDDEFDFERKVRGCDYVPKPICYNNESLMREAPDTVATVAGWGSTDRYSDWVNGRRGNRDTVALLEADVTIMAKGPCKKRWGHRYAQIIDNYMICTRDMASELSEICQEKYVDCEDIGSTEDDDDGTRRFISDLQSGSEYLHSSNHNLSATRRNGNLVGGGFCENDHGGPLVVGEGVTSMVIGIISACLVKEKTNKCYGPFLYTSIYKNRNFIDCAINKDVGSSNCNKNFRAGENYEEEEFTWTDHPDGPSKYDIKRRLATGNATSSTSNVKINNTNSTLNTTSEIDKTTISSKLVGDVTRTATNSTTTGNA